jgi:WD40 repeat protein
MLEQIRQLYPLPFKFLDSYEIEDKNIFFGREEETETLYEKVSENRIILVYGLSGTGKTSLTNCGLANKLDHDEWQQFNIRRDGNFIDSMATAIKKAATTPINHNIQTPEEFKKACRNIFFQNSKSLFFIFDQFEELFIFGDREEREGFAHIIQKVNMSHLNCRFVFVLREEFLARMTELEKIIPSIFSCRLHVEKMTPEKARQAIEKPSKLYGIKLEKGFADAVLDNLNHDTKDIDLTYLQLCMDIVYQLALQENDNKDDTLFFHRGLLEQAGSMFDLLGDFLDEQIDSFQDKETASAILKSLVSEKGTKRQMTAAEVFNHLANMGQNIAKNKVQDVIRRLISLRILHEKDHNDRYELRHDALATKIFEKITSFEKEQLEIIQFLETARKNYLKRGRLLNADDLNFIAPYESRLHLNENQKALINVSKNNFLKAKKEKRKITAAIIIVMLFVMACFSTWALFEKNKAEKNETMFRAGYFNAIANEAVEFDPTKALRLVEYAHSLHPSENITGNLHRIYANNSFHTQILHIPNPPYDIMAMSLAPDEQSLITGHWQGRLRHHDTHGNLISEFIGHEEHGNITSVSFSPDGSLILSNSFDGKMILWSREGEILNILEESDFIRSDGSINLSADNVFHHSSFAPDGKTIAASDMRNGLIRLYNLQGETITSIRIPDLTSYDFLPDARTIISSTITGTIQAHDLSGKLISSFGTVPNARHLGASPLGIHVAVAAGNTIHLFDVDGQKQEEMTHPSGRITSISFSADGNYIIATTTDKKAIMWHISGSKVAELRNQQSMLTATISADNNSIYTATHYGIDRYEISGKLMHYEAIDALSASQNHWMVSADSGNSFLLVLENQAYIFDKHASIVATIDNQSEVMDVFGGRVANRSRGAFSACEKYVILSFGSHVAGIYDFKGNLLKEITAHKAGSYINAIAISPEGNYVLTASQDSTAALWMLDGQILARLKHANWVTAVAFSHDSKYILTGCRSGEIKLWDIDGNPLKTFPQKHQVQVTHLGFSEDNKNIWSFSDSGMRVLRVTDPEGIQYTLTDGGKGDNLLHEWSIRGEHLNSHDFNRELAVRYAFSNDFKHVMVGYNNTNAQLLNLSGHLLQNFADHKGNPRAMAMSPDGETIVTLDNHGVYFWEPKTAYDVFLKTGTYEPLSETDKTAFGIATTQ